MSARNLKFSGLSLALVAGWVMAVSGCGVEVGNPKNPAGDSSTPSKNVTSVLALDSDAALQVIADQMDETASTVNEDDTTSSTSSLMLTGILDVLDDGSCEVGSDGVVTVKASKTGDFTREKVAKLGRKLSITTQFNSTQDRSQIAKWSSKSASLACNPLKKIIAVNFLSVADLSLEVNFSREETYNIKLKNAVKPLRSGYFKADGSRKFSWIKVDPSSSSVKSLRSTITKDVKREAQVVTAKNGQKNISSQITVTDDAPLAVLNDFAVTTGKWQNRKIESGTVQAKQKDGSILESTYKDVLFNADSGCRPQSGTISGKLFDASDLDTPYQTYTVEFTAQAATITLSNGQSLAYTPYTCDADAD